MFDINVKKLAEQLDAAQAILDEIRITSGCDSFRPPQQSSTSRVETALQTAEKAQRNRGNRAAFIGTPDIFGEPAWDMLLDLFVRQTKEEETTVQSVGIHADVSEQTAMRWFKVLEEYGLIVMIADEVVEGRCIVHLTPTGYEGMLRYLTSIAAASDDRG